MAELTVFIFLLAALGVNPPRWFFKNQFSTLLLGVYTLGILSGLVNFIIALNGLTWYEQLFLLTGIITSFIIHRNEKPISLWIEIFCLIYGGMTTGIGFLFYLTTLIL